MSSFTTLNITRNKARDVLVLNILNASDERLQYLLDQMLNYKGSLYNVNIVSEIEEINDNNVLDRVD